MTVALREALGVSERVFGEHLMGSLDEEGRVPLQPDLAWQEGSRWTFVGGVKHKWMDAEVSNADLHQLLAYATALDLPGGPSESTRKANQSLQCIPCAMPANGLR